MGPFEEHDLTALQEKYLSYATADSAGYSPLQCAIHAENIQDVQTLLAIYDQQNTLKQELAYVNEGLPSEAIRYTEETPLVIALKNTALFQMIFTILKDRFQTLLFEQITRVDADGDTLLHTLVEFGRVEPLTLLVKHAAQNQVIRAALIEASKKRNTLYQETPLDIAEHFNASPTMQALRAAGIKNLNPSLAKLNQIKEILKAL